ncbi:MAG: hypothetical protein ACR2PT_18135 [Endozoicomonas sp.]
MDVEVVNQPVSGIQVILGQLVRTIEVSYIPVARVMNEKIGPDLNILRKVTELTAELKSYRNSASESRRITKSVSKEDL